MPKNLSKKADSLASIESIKEQRLLLKQVVMITRATERMQDSLKSVLILGQPSTNIPKSLLKYYHVLSNKIKRKPTEKIKWYLDRLEDLIQGNLKEIISIAMPDQDIYEPGQDSVRLEGYSDEAINLLTEFKRQSHTAVALKILLQQRGVSTLSTKVVVPVEQIKQHIKRLEIREETQRKQLKTHISEMYADLRVMLDGDQYSDEMKKVFRAVMADLEDDQKAIDQGIRIDQLQLSFEVVETGEERKPNPVEAQKQVVTETEEYLEELDQDEDDYKTAPEIGFFRILLKWLNTPWSVTWDDVRKGKG